MFRPKRQETPEAAKARLAMRERILREATEVLGDGEVFRPTSSTFLNKLHSGSSSSDESGKMPDLKKSAPGEEGLNEATKGSQSESSSTSYSYADILQSQTDDSVSVRKTLIKTSQSKPPSLLQKQTANGAELTTVAAEKLQQFSATSEKSQPHEILINHTARVPSGKSDTAKVLKNSSRSNISQMSVLSSIHTSGNNKSDEEGPSHLDTIRTEESFPVTSSLKTVSSTQGSDRNIRNGKGLEVKPPITGPVAKERSLNTVNVAESRIPEVSISLGPPLSPKSATSYSKFLSETSKSSQGKTSQRTSESTRNPSLSALPASTHLNSSNSKIKSELSKVSSTGTTFQKGSTEHSVVDTSKASQTVRSLEKSSSTSTSSTSESSTKNQEIESLPKFPTPLPRSISKRPPVSEENAKDIETLPVDSSRRTLAYSGDEFLSSESSHTKTKNEKLQAADRQSKHKRHHGRPRSDHAERPRNHDKLHSHQGDGEHRTRPYSPPYRSSNRRHRIIRPFMSLPSPVADLVNHCVEANEQIYQHALQLAEQFGKKYTKKKLKASKGAPVAPVSKEDMTIPHQFHHHYYY